MFTRTCRQGAFYNPRRYQGQQLCEPRNDHQKYRVKDKASNSVTNSVFTNLDDLNKVV